MSATAVESLGWMAAACYKFSLKKVTFTLIGVVNLWNPGLLKEKESLFFSLFLLLQLSHSSSVYLSLRGKPVEFLAMSFVVCFYLYGNYMNLTLEE